VLLSFSIAVLLAARGNPAFFEFTRSLNKVIKGVQIGSFENPAVFAPVHDVWTEPGMTRLTGAQTGGYLTHNGFLADHRWGVRIYGPAGDVVHEYPVDYFQLDPNGPPPGKGDAPHATILMPDGSALANWDEGNRLARIDACGDVVWAREGHYHHSIEFADDGSIWTWKSGGDGAYVNQQLVRIDSETGQELENISMLDDVLPSSPYAARLALGLSGHTYVAKDNGRDLLHPNDVDPLPARLADAFPQFPVGSLLVSIRNPNFVGVIHPRTHEFLWWSNGPWVRQHDPEWLPDGTIAVFNNNNVMAEEHRGTGWTPGANVANIIKVVPDFAQDHLVTEWPTERFNTIIQGKLDPLPNGNILVTVPQEGRVFESTPDGRTVMNVNNRVADDRQGRITETNYYPADYFTVDFSSIQCSERI
jgi:hypothetical protein